MVKFTILHYYFASKGLINIYFLFSSYSYITFEYSDLNEILPTGGEK